MPAIPEVILRNFDPKRPPNFQGCAYREDLNALQVRFATGYYQYANVTPELWKEIRNAIDLGGAIREKIVRNPKLHPYIKLDPTKDGIW